jgi:hypothetical protein
MPWTGAFSSDDPAAAIPDGVFGGNGSGGMGIGATLFGQVYMGDGPRGASYTPTGGGSRYPVSPENVVGPSIVDWFIDGYTDPITDSFAKISIGVFNTVGADHPGHAEAVAEFRPGVKTGVTITAHFVLAALLGLIGPEEAVAEARVFTSADPLVADVANAIERAYPGHVVGVNVPMYNANGQLVTDADILLQNSVIQVKSGSGKGLTSQLARTQTVTNLPVIGYGPNLGTHVVRGIQRAEGLVTRSIQLLIEVVAP